MKTLRLIMAIILVVGLIEVFSAFSAEQTKQGKKEEVLTDTQESKDQKKAPAPGSTAIQAPAANLQSLPLTITRLYLKDGKLRVVIKKQGSDRLSDEDYATTKLKVEASTLIKPLEWTLQEVDPQKRLNRRVRGEKDFDTGLAVTERVHVTATLYRGLWKTAKEGNLYLFKKAKKTDRKDLMLSQRSQSGESVPTKRQAQQNLQMAQRIEIFSPSGGEVFDWGDRIRVRYRVDQREEAGDVTFTFVSPTGRELATTTHFYEPLDLPEDLGGVELEPTGLGSEPATLPAEGSEPSTEEWGIGDRVFEWTLPTDTRNSARDGFGFRIVARRGTLFGASQQFTMLPICNRFSLETASFEPHQEILRQGQSVNVVFAFCGWDGLAEDIPPVYIHHSSFGVDEMEMWVEPSYEIIEISDDRVRGALRVTVPRSLDPGGPYVITLRYSGSGYYDTDPFEIAEPMGRSDLEVMDVFKDGEDIIARVGVSDDLGTVEVPIQVNDRIMFATVGPRETDVVVGHMDTPVIMLTPRNCCYEVWDVTVNPDGRIPETNTGNNDLTKRISYFDNYGFIDQYSEHSIVVWNCNAEPISGVSSLVEARQHGVRDDMHGGTEEYDLDVPFTVEIAEDCSDGTPDRTTWGDDIPVGGCALLTVSEDDLVSGVNRMVTFTFSYPISSWFASGNSATIGPID